MKKKLSQNLIFQTKKDIHSNQSLSIDNPHDADGYFLNIYEQILENSKDIFYILNYPELEIEYISPSIKELTGKSREEFLCMSTDLVPLFVHPKDRKLFMDHYKSLNKQQSNTCSIEYRVKPPKGIYRWVNDSHTIIFDSQDNSTKVVGSLHDITDQKLMEDAMKRSRDRLFMAIEATNDGMWDWHVETNEIYFDQRFYTMLGYDPYEFPGSLQEWMKRIHPDDIKSVQHQLERFLESKLNQWVIEYRFKTKNNSWVWILNRGKVFDRDDNDKPLRIVGVHTDITKQKRTEEALISAKEKAQESDRLKSAFLANISHEIRTPMNGIIGFASLLKERVLTAEKQNQFVDIIIQSSSSLLHVIEDIVDISKIEANQLTLTISKFNLNDLFTNLNNQFTIEKQLHGKDHIELKIEVPDYQTEFIFETDEVRLNQVLSNLLSNSFKFTENGTITFGYKVLLPSQIEFFVRDTGIGISEEQKPNLFKHFRQHETTHTRNYGGIGLGLAICEGLVGLMGGRIYFESTTGVGSEFRFRLAYNQAKKNSSLVEDNLIPKNSYMWKDKIIVVVEDDAVNLEYFKTILEPTQAQTIHFQTGEDAIEFCKTKKNIDIILLDIQLPYISGYDTFKMIKEINPTVPIFAQTAYAMPDDAIKCIDMGFTEYIAKPINKNILLSKIDSIFRKQ